MVRIQTRIKLAAAWLCPVFYQKIRFWQVTRYWPSLKNPSTINEIIFSLKMRSSPGYYRYTDKLAVRELISRKIEEHDMQLLRLPELLCESGTVEGFLKKFAREPAFIKANHGSGMCIYYDGRRGQFSRAELATMHEWLSTDYARLSGERCYEQVQRRVFAEKPLRCRDGSLPDDVKVHCYCGKPSVIQVIRRTSGILERRTFDDTWETKEWFENEVLAVDLGVFPRKEILEYARILAAPFEYVRVDFYLVDGVLYFSELTFFPASARLPLRSHAVDRSLGKLFRDCCSKGFETETRVLQVQEGIN